MFLFLARVSLVHLDYRRREEQHIALQILEVRIPYRIGVILVARNGSGMGWTVPGVNCTYCLGYGAQRFLVASHRHEYSTSTHREAQAKALYESHRLFSPLSKLELDDAHWHGWSSPRLRLVRKRGARICAVRLYQFLQHLSVLVPFVNVQDPRVHLSCSSITHARPPYPSIPL